MNLKHKDTASKAPRGDMPWFDHPQRATRDTPIVFGHWSAEGLDCTRQRDRARHRMRLGRQAQCTKAERSGAFSA